MLAWVNSRRRTVVATVVGIALVAGLVVVVVIKPWSDRSVSEQVDRTPQPTASHSPTASSPTPEQETSVSGVVTDDGLELRHPDGAVLLVGPGDLPAGHMVELAPAARDEVPEELGDLQPDGTYWSVESTVEPVRPVELIIPYDPAALTDGARPLVASYDELSGRWIPVETHVDEAAGQLTGLLPSFSWKTWIMDRVAEVPGAASWLEYTLWKGLGNRADRPDCSANPRPDWVVQVVTNQDPNAQLFACVVSEGEGFGLNVVNNRGYPVALEFDRPFTDARSSMLDAGLAGLAAHLAATSGQNRIPLSPTGSAMVLYDPVDTASGHLQGHVRRDASALLMFLAMEFAREAGVDLPVADGRSLGLWTLECYGRTVPAGERLADLDVVAAGNQMVGCLEDTLAHEVRSWGFDPSGDGLWSPAARTLPTDARRMVSALRILRGVSVADWMQTAADILIVDNIPEANLVDVGVRWTDAPRWGAGGEGGIHLYKLPAVRGGPGRVSGTLTAGTLDGESFPRSTSAWVGCAGTPSTLTYRLDEGYQALRATVGLAPHTPADVVARIAVTGDGDLLADLEVSTSTIEGLSLDLTGVAELEISSERIRGECEDSPTPYGVLGDAYLVPTRDALPELPETYEGTWDGQMTQPTSPRSPYSMEVTFRPGLVGDVVGEVSYPDLECGGELTLTRAEAGRLIVAETIEYGTFACIERGFHEVRPTAAGSLDFSYFRTMMNMNEEPEAWATLTPSGR